MKRYIKASENFVYEGLEKYVKNNILYDTPFPDFETLESEILREYPNISEDSIYDIIMFSKRTLAKELFMQDFPEVYKRSENFYDSCGYSDILNAYRAAKNREDSKELSLENKNKSKSSKWITMVQALENSDYGLDDDTEEANYFNGIINTEANNLGIYFEGSTQAGEGVMLVMNKYGEALYELDYQEWLYTMMNIILKSKNLSEYRRNLRSEFKKY